MSRLPYVLIPLALFLFACGQKGPLYIEGHEPAGLKVVKPAKPKTEPAPEVEPSAPN
ncbi:MAG: LPS translocon maturation chaperone LptM [Methylococcus sp.]